MSGESALAFLQKIYAPRSILTTGLSHGAAAAIFAGLSLLGVCGIAGLLTVIARDSKEVLVGETMATAVNRSTLPVSRLRDGAVPELPAHENHLQVPHKHAASLSADKLQVAARKHGRRPSSRKNASTKHGFSSNSGAFHEARRTPGNVGADEAMLLDHNETTELDKDALVFVRDEGYYDDVAKGFNVTGKVDDERALEGSSDAPRQNLSLRKASTFILNSSLSSSSKVLAWSTSSLRGRTAIADSATPLSISSPTPRNETTAAKASNSPAVTTTANITKSLVEESDARGLLADEEAEGGAAAASLVARLSPWLLFCFYDDRSSIRSPGFSMYDFPAQLCTDMAYCCADVNSRGQVVVNKQLRQFFNVVGKQFLPGRHLFVTLGGHRVLVHHLDAALTNTARFATELSEEVQDLGAGGLAIYLEDVEMLKHAFRVHDLIMAVRGVSVAVVLPRDLRQQVRYYHTEIYANTKDMVVISPPSQGYGSDSRQQFATCPHPRRSVHEGSSLEFIYQLSKTLLSSMADGADYASGAAAAEDEHSAPRYLIGISFGGLKFQLKNRSHHDVGSPGTFVRRVPYREICKQPWRHWYDNMSECYVAWDGERSWMSSLGPRSVGFARELANGLAVFDVDFDDHSGECGNKFPLLKALRAALLAQRSRKTA
ncbi:hypothetical protein V5799_011019 [Amblyomma americanum]|uniref:Uncharacterized protein n=1 Tax=Amblyomma americanum TaxID=6943 RepID=A0AAQ4EIH2_AMBAM